MDPWARAHKNGSNPYVLLNKKNSESSIKIKFDKMVSKFMTLSYTLQN